MCRKRLWKSELPRRHDLHYRVSVLCIRIFRCWQTQHFDSHVFDQFFFRRGKHFKFPCFFFNKLSWYIYKASVILKALASNDVRRRFRGWWERASDRGEYHVCKGRTTCSGYILGVSPCQGSPFSWYAFERRVALHEPFQTSMCFRCETQYTTIGVSRGTSSCIWTDSSSGIDRSQVPPRHHSNHKRI